MDILFWILAIFIAIKYYVDIFMTEEEDVAPRNRRVKKKGTPRGLKDRHTTGHDRGVKDNHTVAASKGNFTGPEEARVPEENERPHSRGIEDVGESSGSGGPFLEKQVTGDGSLALLPYTPPSNVHIHQKNEEQPSLLPQFGFLVTSGDVINWTAIFNNMKTRLIIQLITTNPVKKLVTKKVIPKAIVYKPPPLPSENNSYITSYYEKKYLAFIRNIGPGMFNTSLFMDSLTNKLVLKKVIPRTIVSEEDFYRQLGVVDLLREKDQFMKIFGHYQIGHSAGVIFTEYFDECTLDSLFKNDLVTPLKLQKILQQILEAVSHLKKHGVLHCNIKGENILVNDANKIKLTGFGTSMYNHEGRQRLGTIGYAAPEVLAQCFRKYPELPSYPCDVYSVGATVFFNLFGHFPGYPPCYVLEDVTDMEMYLDFLVSGIPVAQNGVRFPPDLDPLLEGLLKRLLEPKPEKRYTADEALDHLYFSRAPGEIRMNFSETPVVLVTEEATTGTESAAGRVQLSHTQEMQQSESSSKVFTNQDDDVSFLKEQSYGPQKPNEKKKKKGLKKLLRFPRKKSKKSANGKIDPDTPQKQADEKEKSADTEIEPDSPQLQAPGKKKSRLRRFISRIFHPHRKDKL